MSRYNMNLETTIELTAAGAHFMDIDVTLEIDIEYDDYRVIKWCVIRVWPDAKYFSKSHPPAEARDIEGDYLVYLAEHQAHEYIEEAIYNLTRGWFLDAPEEASYERYRDPSVDVPRGPAYPIRLS